jgi:hypothetical protein
VIVPDTNNWSILLMCPVNPRKLLAAPGAGSKPGVAELGQPWSRNTSEVFVCGKVREDVVVAESERCNYCRETPIAQDCHVKKVCQRQALEGLIDSGVANEREQRDVILLPGR